MYGDALYHKHRALREYRLAITQHLTKCLVEVDFKDVPELAPFREKCIALGVKEYVIRQNEDVAVSQFMASVPLDKRPVLIMPKQAA